MVNILKAMESWDNAVKEFDRILKEANDNRVEFIYKPKPKVKVTWKGAKRKSLNIQVDEWDGEKWVFKNNYMFQRDKIGSILKIPFYYLPKPKEVYKTWGWNYIRRITFWQWIRVYINPADANKLADSIIKTRDPITLKWLESNYLIFDQEPTKWPEDIPDHIKMTEYMHVSRPRQPTQTDHVAPADSGGTRPVGVRCG